MFCRSNVGMVAPAVISAYEPPLTPPMAKLPAGWPGTMAGPRILSTPAVFTRVRLKESRAVFSTVGEKMWFSDNVMYWFRLFAWLTFTGMMGLGVLITALSIVKRAKSKSLVVKFW